MKEAGKFRREGSTGTQLRSLTYLKKSGRNPA
ncbi:hypothetical protein BF29_1941 [Heyndrickxia coagulans DSM 1 = ATCC 7050]|nr:hypothetical protein BF29_1941 [Heyndrickxia coagulans DSM 1 = ATCC 7050]